jgi:hypothetical protein
MPKYFPGGGAIISTALDLLDQGITTTDMIKNLSDQWKSEKNRTNDQNVLAKEYEYTSLVDQTVDIFSVILSNRKNGNQIPLILVVDDAQWADPLTLALLTRLVDAGNDNNWPLFIITTCWESSLKEQQVLNDSEEAGDNFANLLTYAEQTITAKRVNLQKLQENDILSIIQTELPNVEKEAQILLAQNCSGDLELLWDFFKRLKRTPGYLTSDGKLNVPLQKLNFNSHKKKELARERILELGYHFACLIAWGIAQGIKYSNVFIQKCIDTFNSEFEIDIQELSKLDNPY